MKTTNCNFLNISNAIALLHFELRTACETYITELISKWDKNGIYDINLADYNACVMVKHPADESLGTICRVNVEDMVFETSEEDTYYMMHELDIEEIDALCHALMSVDEILCRDND